MTIDHQTLPAGRQVPEQIPDIAPLFQDARFELDEPTIAELDRIGKRGTYPAGYILCRQGELGDRLFIVLDGLVLITQHIPEGGELPIGTVERGKYFGEMSLLDNTPRTATCTTLEKTELLEITKENFDHIVKNSPSVAFSLIYRMMTNLRDNNARAINALLSKNQELKRANAQLKKTRKELVRHERYKRDLEIAGEVQRHLLPTALPEFEDFSFAVYLGGIHAGGDFYDIFPLNDEYTGILMGDVADQGVQAALLMAVARTLFLNESKRALSPLEVATAVNRALLELSTRTDMFVMAFYGILHMPTGIFSYIIAGHERPFLARRDKGIGQLPGRGTYLGQATTVHLVERRIRFLAGDRLVLFSNGVVESQNLGDEPFGYDRLRQLIAAHQDKKAAELIDIISQELWVWQAGNEQVTDFALLICEAG